MEKHISKKILAGVCALSGAFILAACDPITAIPQRYNDPIVKVGDKAVDLEDNKLGKIYDAIATDRNSKIVSDILDEVAINKFGTYEDVKKAGDPATSEDDKMAYINAHASVFKRTGDDKVTGKSEKEVQLHRLATFCKDIDDRISEVFYNEITSGSYNDDEGRFDESKLWMAHYYEFYDLKEIAPGAEFKKFFVTNKLTKENAYSQLNDLYSNSQEGARGYIETKVFPQILKDKLVEEYVYNNNYSTLGRAYARKVSYIKVSYESDIVPRNIFKKFAEMYIQVPANGEAVNYEVISNAIKGFKDVGAFDATTNGIIPFADESDPSYVLLDQSITGAEKFITVPDNNYYKLDGVTLIPAGDYFKKTKLGDIIESYNKAIKAAEAGRFPTSTDKTELDKFTASGKSMQYGLREKLISLAKEDYTTDGWFVKNGGLSELPSALRDRLFNINVANTLDALNDETAIKYETNVDTPTKVGDFTHYPYGSYEKDKEGKNLTRLPYLRNIDGKKFVIPAKSQSYEDDPYNYIYQDVDGKALYIVQVLEAPSTPKLNLESETSYSKLLERKADAFLTEDIARSVAKVLGSKDSYIKDAYTEVLKKYSFTFYETSLYEHFKSEYPDLFDEE